MKRFSQRFFCASAVACFWLAFSLAGCDRAAYYAVVIKPNRFPDRKDLKYEVEAAASKAGLRRIRDWNCEGNVKPVECTYQSDLETSFAGRGQAITFDLVEGKYVYSYGGAPAHIVPETVQDLENIRSVYTNMYGQSAVETRKY